MTHIIVDTREPKRVAIYFKRCGFTVDVMTLPAGDVASEKIIIERKTTVDLASSIIYNKFFIQMEELARFAEQTNRLPFLFISGTIDDVLEHSAIDPDAILGAIAATIVRYGIGVIWAFSFQDSLDLQRRVLKKFEEGKFLIPKRKRLSSYHRMAAVAHIATTLHIPVSIAERLYEKYGGLRNILLLERPEELLTIRGIGPATLKRIKFLVGWK